MFRITPRVVGSDLGITISRPSMGVLGYDLGASRGCVHACCTQVCRTGFLSKVVTNTLTRGSEVTCVTSCPVCKVVTGVGTFTLKTDFAGPQTEVCLT